MSAGVAQLVAQAICNRQVVGSSPTTGSKLKNGSPEIGTRLNFRRAAE